MSRLQRSLVLAAAAIGLCLESSTALASSPKGRFIDMFEEAMRQAEAAYRSRQEEPGSRRELVSIWNTQGCGLTDRAPLHLAAPARVDRIELWYNWTAGESSSPFQILSSGGRVAAEGIVSRASCDPYQTSWCVAAATQPLTLPAGDYVVRMPRGRICQNPASANRGFIRAWGSDIPGPRSAPETAVRAPSRMHLGNRWAIHEEIAGRYWNGTWTRRPGTDIFDAVWRDSLSGQSFTDVIELRDASSAEIRLFRRGTGGYYTGTLSPDGRSIRGSASWYPSGGFWTADISGR